jgi:hypothetical protein
LSQTITIFLDSLGGELSRILSPPVNDEQVSVLRTLFEILLLIVKRPTPSSSKSTPSPLVINIVGFCLDQVLPQMRQGEQEQEFVTVTPPFYDLLYFSLLNHFDRLGVRANEVLAAFARSLEMVDITLFKQNLNHLEQLNTKINLYSRWPYLDHLMATLFKVLLSKTHDLLRDEIILALHHMASVTWEGFFSHTLPGVVGLLLPPQFKEPLLRGFTTATDSPTFSLNTNRLINDANYYAVNATNAQRIGP